MSKILLKLFPWDSMEVMLFFFEVVNLIGYVLIAIVFIGPIFVYVIEWLGVPHHYSGWIALIVFGLVLTIGIHVYLKFPEEGMK